MKNLLIISTILILSACNSKDEQFCECLKAGEELNVYSSSLLQEEITKEKSDKLKNLKKLKTEACKDYQTMDGPEMLKKKAECQ